jgi:hypothetical protein
MYQPQRPQGGLSVLMEQVPLVQPAGTPKAVWVVQVPLLG